MLRAAAPVAAEGVLFDGLAEPLEIAIRAHGLIANLMRRLVVIVVERFAAAAERWRANQLADFASHEGLNAAVYSRSLKPTVADIAHALAVDVVLLVRLEFVATHRTGWTFGVSRLGIESQNLVFIERHGHLRAEV